MRLPDRLAPAARRRGRHLVAWACLALSACGSASVGIGLEPEGMQTIDLMPLYWQFHERAHDQPIDAQVRLFREMVADQRPEVYNADVMNVPGGRTFDEFLPEVYPKALAWTAPHTETMRTLSEELATSLPRHVAEFRQTFPDFAFDGRVYFLYAVGAFDGAARTVAGKPALLFGLDVIATIHGAEASVAPLLHHELFHAHHGPLIGTTGRGLPLYLSVWVEGLATLVARQLNPSASDVAIYGLPTNTPARVRDDLPRLAGALRATLDSTRPEDYDTWFLGNDSDAEIPRRSGYYLGYLVAAHVQRGRTLRDLARLSAAEVRPLVEAALADPAALVASSASTPPDGT